MTILDKLADHARERIAAAKETVSAQDAKTKQSMVAARTIARTFVRTFMIFPPLKFG